MSTLHILEAIWTPGLLFLALQIFQPSELAIGTAVAAAAVMMFG